jgi:nicotinamidase-related amidase
LRTVTPVYVGEGSNGNTSSYQKIRALGWERFLSVKGVARRSDMDWSKHAVLLIDVQNDSLNATKDFPAFQNNITGLLSFARRSGIEVIHIRVTFKQDQSSTWVEGTPGAEPAPFAQEAPDEKVFYKHWIDGFYNTGLEEYLRARQIQHVLCAGLATPICVVITALSAKQRGFLTTIVRDCCAARKKYHDLVLELYGDFVSDVIDSEEIADRYTQWEEQVK